MPGDHLRGGRESRLGGLKEKEEEEEAPASFRAEFLARLLRTLRDFVALSYGGE